MGREGGEGCGVLLDCAGVVRECGVRHKSQLFVDLPKRLLHLAHVPYQFQLLQPLIL